LSEKIIIFRTAEEETMSDSDVPSQYKKRVDEYTCDIIEAARKLWPIVRELGEAYECEDEQGAAFVVRLEAKGDGAKHHIERLNELLGEAVANIGRQDLTEHPDVAKWLELGKDAHLRAKRYLRGGNDE
jgi:tRNA(Ser,Leu) C12 N-acetylase TAN1